MQKKRSSGEFDAATAVRKAAKGGGAPQKMKGGNPDGRELCKNFAAGRCTSESMCRFRHELP